MVYLFSKLFELMGKKILYKKYFFVILIKSYCIHKSALIMLVSIID